MADRICTRFNDADGLDLGCHLVTKEYMLEAYPSLVDWMKDPGLWTWGFGSQGQLGNNSTLNRSSPVQTISGGTNWRSISSRYVNSAGIKTDGTLWLWGCGSNGQLGNNAITNRSSPVQTISGGNNWRSVSLGFAQSASIKTDGTLWLWGQGICGKLGNNSVTNRSSPVQTISGGNNWKSVSAGGNTAAIKTDGTLWMWGIGATGQLGNNSTTSRSSPVQTISGGNDWKGISLGLCHSAAIKTDGSLWMWGDGTFGTLGTNSVIRRSSPVQTISGGTNWRSVSLGCKHSAAIKTDGSLWGWGEGDNGKLGNNLTIDQSSPVQTVSGGNNWKSVDLGALHSAAIKTDGTLWLWGSATVGRLGNNSTIVKSSPVQTISGGNNWKSVSLGDAFSAAIRDEGEY